MKDRQASKNKAIESPSPKKNKLVTRGTDSGFQTSVDPSEIEDKEKKSLEVPPNPAEQKETNFVTRTKWTLIMLFSFLFVVSLGHFYVTLLVIALVICSFN